MKRYRVLPMDFDMRANMLKIEIKNEWADAVRNSHLEARARILNGLRQEFGDLGFEQKVQNVIDLGAAPVSLVAFHNLFFREVRYAFVMGSYYPALAGVCALGERVLNHLIRTLRDDFHSTPEYATVARKKSFNDWRVASETLRAWGVLVPAAVDAFGKLKNVRHRSLHFNPDVEGDVRPKALHAIHLFQEIMQQQFGVFAPWHIPNDAGLSLVRKTAESDPFVRRVVVPNCVYVGPEHDLHRMADGRWGASDRETYPEQEVDDAEWVRLFKAAPHAGVPAGGNVQISMVSR